MIFQNTSIITSKFAVPKEDYGKFPSEICDLS